MAGILAADWDTVGMYVDGSKNPVPLLTPITTVGEDPSRPVDAKVLFPNVGYKQQLGALIFAQIYSRLNTDMSLVNKLRVWIDGQNGQIDVPLEQQVRFYDPQSGYTYIARKYGSEIIDGKTVDKGIASRMVQHANALVIASYVVERDETGHVVLDEFGCPKVQHDVDGEPELLPPDQTRVGELDAVRRAHRCDPPDRQAARLRPPRRRRQRRRRGRLGRGYGVKG